MTKGLKSLERIPFVPFVAVLFGLVAGILVLATPQWLLERGVVASGLPELIAAAAPPLGDKARIMAALLAAIGTAGLLWAALTPLRYFVKPKLARGRGSRIEAADTASDAAPAVFASHPDAPARRPLFAESDLGAPFMSDEAIAHVRDELVLETIFADDVPLVAFEPDIAADPQAIEECAAEPVTEAIEHIEEPQPEKAPEPLSAPPLPTPIAAADQSSIAGLLDRLETALRRREDRTGSTAPVLPGDMAALRKALGGSTARH